MLDCNVFGGLITGQVKLILTAVITVTLIIFDSSTVIPLLAVILMYVCVHYSPPAIPLSDAI